MKKVYIIPNCGTHALKTKTHILMNSDFRATARGQRNDRFEDVDEDADDFGSFWDE